MSGAVPALQAALAAEHAAIFGYGALGARLTGPALVAARSADVAHRDRRDATAALLVDLKAEPAEPERAYRLPFPLDGPAAAMRLAIQLEVATAAAWRSAVPEVTGDARGAAVRALSDSAVRAAQWRAKATPGAPATVPFPGA
jgi:hypothetical protein